LSGCLFVRESIGTEHQVNLLMFSKRNCGSISGSGQIKKTLVKHSGRLFPMSDSEPDAPGEDRP